MSPFPNQLILLEGFLAFVFVALVVHARKRLGIIDALLWVLVWCTRLLASLNGSLRLESVPSMLPAYMGLQACSAMALIIIFVRSEVRVLKEKWAKRLMLQVIGAGRPNDGAESITTDDRHRQAEDRRCRPQFTVDHEVRVPVRVTLVGREEPPLQATVFDFYSQGMRLLIDRDLPLGTPVCVESEDMLLEGRVAYCCREGSSFAIGLTVERLAPGASKPATETQALTGVGSDGTPYRQIQ